MHRRVSALALGILSILAILHPTVSTGQEGGALTLIAMVNVNGTVGPIDWGPRGIAVGVDGSILLLNETLGTIWSLNLSTPASSLDWGQRFLAAAVGESVYFINMTGSPEYMHLLGAPVTSVSWGPQGLLAAAALDGIHALAPRSGEAWFTRLDYTPFSIDWSMPSGLIGVGVLNVQRLYFLDDAGKVLGYRFIASTPVSLSWDPSGYRIAVGTDTGRLVVIDFNNGPLWSKILGEGWVMASWSPQGLIAAGAAGVVHIYDPDGNLVASASVDGQVSGIAWSPDGSMIAVGAGDTVYLYGVEPPPPRTVTVTTTVTETVTETVTSTVTVTETITSTITSTSTVTTTATVTETIRETVTTTSYATTTYTTTVTATDYTTVTETITETLTTTIHNTSTVTITSVTTRTETVTITGETNKTVTMTIPITITETIEIPRTSTITITETIPITSTITETLTTVLQAQEGSPAWILALLAVLAASTALLLRRR